MDVGVNLLRAYESMKAHAADVIRRELFVTPDVDECKGSERVCGAHAICTNIVGSFVCTCQPEYTGNARAPDGCRDVNECEVLERPCGTHALCENAAPGYNCVCPQGYRAKPNPQIACEQVIIEIDQPSYHSNHCIKLHMKYIFSGRC